MIQMPESQYGSARMRPSQIQIDDNDQQISTRRRRILSPTFSQNLPLFRELQARQLQQRQEPEQTNSLMTLSDERSISCHAQMVKSLLFNLSLQTFFISYFAYMHWKFSHRFVLLQLWVQDLITIFILIYYNYRKGDDCIWQLIETMFLFFFKIFIVFYYEVQAFKIYFISIMMLGVSSILLLMKLTNKLKNPQKSNSELIIQFFKTVCCLQLLLVTLKWEEGISWTWFQVFLLIWVFLVVCSLLLLISLFSCFEVLYKIYTKKQQCYYLAGNLWIFFMMIGFTIFPFLFLLKVSVYYENDQFIKLDEAAQYIILNVLFSLILLVYTVCFYKQIKLYLKEVQGISEQQQENSIQSPAQKNQEKKIEYVKLSMPLYLIKLSCTYFAILDKAAFEYNRINNRHKKNKQKQTKQKESDNGKSTSTMRETFKKILQKPLSSNSLVEQKKNEVDFEIQLPPVTDNVVKLKQEIVEELQQSHSEHQENAKSIKSIKSELESSVNSDKCLVCYENQPNIVFLPCRHGGICQQCAEDIIQKQNECYLCRRTITQMLRVQRNDAKQLEVQDASMIH